MTFNHVELDLPTLERDTIDGVRYYQVPGENDLIKLVYQFELVLYVLQ